MANQGEFLRVILTRGSIVSKRHEKGHQGYEISLKSSINAWEPIEIVKIFNVFRDLKRSLELVDVGEKKKIPIQATFPPTFAGSALGIGLSEDQLRQRTFLLNKWVIEITSSYHNYPPEAQALIREFLELTGDNESAANVVKLLQAGNVNLVKPTLSPDLFGAAPGTAFATSAPAGTGINNTKDPGTPTTAPVTRSASSVTFANTQKSSSSSSKADGVRPVSQSLVHSSSTISARSVASPPSGISRSASMTEIGIHKRASMSSFINAHNPGGEVEHFVVAETMEIFVQFGKLAPKTANDRKIHVTYETCLTLLDSKITLVSAVYAFDGYRKLYNDLKAASCTNIDPFPPTYSQSSLGIALSQEQLAERCFGLDRWIGLVFLNFKSRSVKAQQVIENFLGVNRANRLHNTAMEILLGQASPGSINAAITSTDPASTSPAIDVAPDKSGVSSRDIGASIAPTRLLDNSIEVLVAMDTVVGMADTSDGRVHVEYKTFINVLKKPDEGGEPVIIHSHTTSGPFKNYSELRQELLKMDIGRGLLYAASYSKSRLGIQLTISEYEERVSSLNKWISSILEMYPDMPRAAQRLVVNFLSPVDLVLLTALSGVAEEEGDSSDDEDVDKDEKADVSKPLPSFATKEPMAGGTRRGSVRGQSVAGDISQYADVGLDTVPIQVATRLQSAVFLGSLAPKPGSDKKMHLTFQCIISILPQYITESLPQIVISAVQAFDGYRQLNKEIEKVTFVKLAHPFPPTYTQSSLGIALTKEQVQERCAALNLYMAEVLRAFNKFPPNVQQIISTFFALEQDPDGLVQNELLAGILNTSEVPVVVSSPHEIRATSASMAVLGSNRLVSEVNPVGNDNPPTSIGPLQVSVMLSYMAGKNETDKKLHLTYQTTLIYIESQASAGQATPSITTHSVSRTFDGYRKLREELVNLGVAESIEFPKTYSKSQLGYSLSKDEIADRVSTLNRWMGAVLRLYASFPQACKLAISDFLDIDLVDNVGPAQLLTVLDTFGIQAPIPAPGSSSASSSNTQTDETISDSLRVTADIMAPPMLLHNWILVQVTFARREAQPADKTRVQYDTVIRFREFDIYQQAKSVRKVCTYPFDSYRTLEANLSSVLNANERTRSLLTVPFPETYTQSTFGLSLSSQQLVSRCAKLHSWISAVLGLYHLFPPAAQELLSNFLKIDEGDPSESENKVISNILRFGPSLNDGDVKQDLKAIYEPALPEPIVGNKKTTDITQPKGCCTIS